MDAQEWNPFQILGQRRHQAAVSEAVFQQSEAQIAESRKDHRASQPDFEAVKEEAIDLELESKDQVVEK